LDDNILIWKWKTSILLINMVRALPSQSSIGEPTRFVEKTDCAADPGGSQFEPVFSFLDHRHIAAPSILAEPSSQILLNVHRLCPHSQPGQQPRVSRSPAIVRSYVLSVSDVLEYICTLRFFPDVSARGGASPGHFYADASQRVFGIQIEATSYLTKRETVQELLVPVQTLKASARSPVYRRASVCYEPFIGRRLCMGMELVSCVMLSAVVLYLCLRCVRGIRFSSA
jgi:hypothetical protein